MSTPYLGEVRLFSFNFAPKGWSLASGQLLPINQNQALFSLFGTFYGGNGVNTFELPNLQGRTPMFYGGQTVIGQQTGTETVTLTSNQYPAHSHSFAASTTGGLGLPTGNYLGATAGGRNIYAVGGTPQTLNPSALAASQAGSQPHQNMQPFLVMTYAIALSGIFPTRN